MNAAWLVLLNLCSGPATPATAYLDCQPTVGEPAYCPGEDSEEPECVVTWVGELSNGRSIVRWEHAR